MKFAVAEVRGQCSVSRLAWVANLLLLACQNNQLLQGTETSDQIRVVSALGTTQALAWASSYYLPAIRGIWPPAIKLTAPASNVTAKVLMAAGERDGAEPVRRSRWAPISRPIYSATAKLMITGSIASIHSPRSLWHLSDAYKSFQTPSTMKTEHVGIRLSPFSSYNMVLAERFECPFLIPALGLTGSRYAYPRR